MKVLIVNTSENVGGAAVAANRLMEALTNNGVKAKMLVQHKNTDNISVVGLKPQWLCRLHWLSERFGIFAHMHFMKHNLWAVDTASSGSDITRLPEFREADVIHLHWINHGMLSLADIRRIVQSGKPVVWTMHDLWPATGICHYARQCAAFKSTCHNCRLLPTRLHNDLSNRIWRKKKAIYQHSGIYFVACSRWLELQAKQSALLAGQRVTNIPNPIDTRIFAPADKRDARLRIGLPTDRRVILFVAQRVDDERKGVKYFIEAVKQLAAARPSFASDTCIAIIGRNSDIIAQQIGPMAHALDFVADEHAMATVYNAADAFVLPSLEDNLPNTIMEAMACGVPCVGFRVGGIPEMIDHRVNGYVAAFKSVDDLATGLAWVLYEAPADMGTNARHKVTTRYSQQSVAARYYEIYNEMIAQRRYNI